MSRIPIALELYSVRHALKADPGGTLKAVAEMGYDGVEFAGAPEHPAGQLRAWLDEFGLGCCGWHTPFNLAQPDKLAETIAFNQQVGNTRLIIPSLPESLVRTRSGWLEAAGFFNRLAGELAPHGMVTGYHNHYVEFKPLDGELPWDTFFGNTDTAVIAQLDTGNALRGGADPLSLLQRYPGRAVTVHLKPYSLKAGATDPDQGYRPVIGEDDLPWQAIFETCETTGGTQWYIVEYESDAYPPLEAVERCLKALKAMGK
jgi:sugar phosphate isomerase/epimerase